MRKEMSNRYSLKDFINSEVIDKKIQKLEAFQENLEEIVKLEVREAIIKKFPNKLYEDVYEKNQAQIEQLEQSISQDYQTEIKRKIQQLTILKQEN